MPLAARISNEEKRMKCPVDQTELLMSDRQGIEIDYCPKCRGVWLDRGELDKIIDRSAAVAPQPEPPPQGRAEDYRRGDSYERDRYDRDRHEGDRYDSDRDDRGYRERRYRKRKSFLDELFDFD